MTQQGENKPHTALYKSDGTARVFSWPRPILALQRTHPSGYTPTAQPLSVPGHPATPALRNTSATVQQSVPRLFSTPHPTLSSPHRSACYEAPPTNPAHCFTFAFPVVGQPESYAASAHTAGSSCAQPHPSFLRLGPIPTVTATRGSAHRAVRAQAPPCSTTSCPACTGHPSPLLIQPRPYRLWAHAYGPAPDP